MLQSLWSFIYDKLFHEFQLSESAAFMIGQFVAHESVFLSLNILLYLVHHFNLFAKYKIQNVKYPSRELIIECIKLLAFNQIVMIWPASYVIWLFGSSLGLHFSPILPPVQTILLHLFVFMLVEDCLFYWIHRGLHHPAIYKYIHKQHHEFKATIGIASEYAHPVEWFTANLIPFLTGPMLMKTHVAIFWIWSILRLVESTDAHSGYRFPFSPFHLLPFQGGSERHEYHHYYNIGSYGSFFCFWDWIMGTDVAFRKHLAEKSKKHEEIKGQSPIYTQG